MGKNFRYSVAVCTLLALLLCLFCGCAEKPQEDSAFLGEYVESEEKKPTDQVPEEKPVPEKQPEEKPEDTPAEEEPSETPSQDAPDEEKTIETPSQDTPAEKPAEPEVDEEEETKKPFSMDKAIKVATFNIKNAMGGKTIDQIATMLKELDADLIGLQEVYCNNPKVSGGNQVQTIAEKAGYPYYYFTPCIQIGDNHTKYTGTDNAAGQAIISKHPILTSEVIWPSDQGDFGLRNFARHEIDINGKTVAFYNCHLDFDKGRFQYEEVQDRYMSKDQYAICVGDFNETMDEMFLQFDYEKFYSFAFGEEMENPYRNKKGNQVIDHIVVTKDTMSWYDEEVQNGYYVIPHNGASDHNLVYGYVNLLD